MWEISFLFRPNLAAELIFSGHTQFSVEAQVSPRSTWICSRNKGAMALLSPYSRHALCSESHYIHPDVACPCPILQMWGLRLRGNGITGWNVQMEIFLVEASEQLEMATERKSPDGINLGCLSTHALTLFLCFL